MIGLRSGLVMLALLLIIGACAEASDVPGEPTTSASPQGAANEADVNNAGPSDYGDDVTGAEDKRDPGDLAEVPGIVTSIAPGEVDPDDVPGEQDPGDPLVALPDPKVSRQLEPLVAKARSDLASVLGVDESDFAVAVAELIIWPDASLGCPQPGMAYAQVQVDGWRIVLMHGDTQYVYHGGGARPDPFLCRSPNFPRV